MALSLTKQRSNEIPIVVKRKGVRKSRGHLTKEEYETYRQSKNWPYIEPLLSSSPSHLTVSNVFRSLLPVQRDYVLLLACLQRVCLPLELAFPTKIIFKNFPLVDLPNFQYFNELYDRHYPALYPMDAERLTKKAKNKVAIVQTITCLWFAGYSLKEGLGGQQVITTRVLEEASKIANYHRSSMTIVGKMLSREVNSEIQKKPLFTFDEAEKNQWISKGIYPSTTPLEDNLYHFSFTYLVERVHRAVAEDHYDNEDQLLFRSGKKTISQNHWKNMVRYIRYFAIQAKSAGVSDLNEYTFSQTYRDVLGKLKGYNSRNSYRVALRLWLNWVNRTFNTQYNLERLMPSPKRVLSKKHGRVFSMSKAYLLIQTLLNDQCSLFNENDIMHFRYRRACLLLLSTAARPHEVVNLLQSALYQDSHGGFWIRFHKTKTIRNQPGRVTFDWVHEVPVKPDAVRWFQELMHFAPTERLFFPIEWDGDGLTMLRLLASKHNDAPIRTSRLWSFLARIQRKLWPDQTKPYFSPHNLRALHLTYRRLIGDADVLLERQAGHTHSSSKIPYTQTIPAEEVGKFGDILKKGVWQTEKMKTAHVEETANGEEHVEEITKISSKFTITPNKLEEVYMLAQRVMEAAPLMFQGKVLESDDELEISSVSAGGYTHNCNAHVLLNCGHTPGHCRACDYYSPDEGTEDAHRIEIFREMLHYYFCKDAEKQYKSTGHRTMVFQKAEDIKDRLDKTESKLWVDKFGMKPPDANKLHSMLWKKAKAYFRHESKTNPKPSAEEIFRYLA